MIKIGSSFSGIGAWESAIKGLDIKYKLEFYCEVDKYANTSYKAIHNADDSINIGDITKPNMELVKPVDLFLYSPPCQAFSVAGKMEGLNDKRGTMFWYTLPIIKKANPKVCIMENVKGLTTKKFKDLFEDMKTQLEELGYNNYWKVLNTKDYGIPQNRERVFLVSIRKDIDDGSFDFPEDYDNGQRLKDFLDNEVDEKYYISQEKTEKLISQFKNGEISKLNTNPSGKGMNGNVNTSNVANTITTNKGEGQKICIPCITPDRVEKRQNGRRFKEDGEPMFTLTAQDKHGILQVGNIVDTGNFKNPQRGRIYSPDGISPALNTVGGGGLEPKILENMTYKIRKLTPKECWRLQGFTDEEFETARQVLIEVHYKGKDRANSQLYKQAGNSLTVNVAQAIISNLLQLLEV